MQMDNLNRMPKLTIPVVVACILRNDTILLLRRTQSPYKGLWSLPGGKIKFGEFAYEAVRRETKEETSLELSSTKYLGLVCEKVYKDNSIVESHIICVFSCKPLSETIISSEEGELKWFRHSEVTINKKNMIPTDYMIVKEMIINRSNGSYNCSVKQLDTKYKVIEFAKLT